MLMEYVPEGRETVQLHITHYTLYSLPTMSVHKSFARAVEVKIFAVHVQGVTLWHTY